jgi:hypothetical protein
LEAEVSHLQTQLSTKSIADQELQELKIENRRLEDNLRRLSESPIFKGIAEKV